jgi:phage gp46-like protein
MTDFVDIALELDAVGRYDISFENGDIKKCSGFDTAIIVSLLTDARASETQISRPEDRKGWIANLMSIVKGRQLGGHLWLLDQRRLTQESLNLSIDYARKSLAWMLEDGIIKKIEVSGEIVPLKGIELQIRLIALDGTTSSQYVKLWGATGQA